MVLIVILVNFIGAAFATYQFWVNSTVAKISLNHHSKKALWRPTFKSSEKNLTKGFYRLYKFIHLQIAVGTRQEEIYKQLYRVASTKALEKALLELSVIVAQSHDVEKGLKHLKKYFKDEEGIMFIGVLENMQSISFSNQAFERLDHLLFQKYLSSIRIESQKIKKMYIASIILLTLATTIMLLLPLVDQMMYSAKKIFY